eukprot:gnl/TRDRNA2_/TRDRNA2_134335_c0_seq3.p1 gnl/TRDRNA2_/TRDRNA2_134335_c0~~gnl/TRDRNA2_/TRDRNA2_134335_c0_seq3.p1  ORF type:complete len:108 (-),score=7.74 gnl/TRDRNA2_/TRDRNA2_134335_c0_seq3:320-643(-)
MDSDRSDADSDVDDCESINSDSDAASVAHGQRSEWFGKPFVRDRLGKNLVPIAPSNRPAADSRGTTHRPFCRRFGQVRGSQPPVAEEPLVLPSSAVGRLKALRESAQ